MALVTAEATIPDLNYEYHTITVDTIGQASANTFTAYLQNPLRNVVQCRLLAAHVHANVQQTEHLYVSVDELDSNFNDRAAISGSSVGAHAGQGNISVVRSAFGSVISEGNELIAYKDNYSIAVQYIDPILRIDKLTVRLLNQNGVAITNPLVAGENFLVLRFVCRRPNL